MEMLGDERESGEEGSGWMLEWIGLSGMHAGSCRWRAMRVGGWRFDSFCDVVLSDGLDWKWSRRQRQRVQFSGMLDKVPSAHASCGGWGWVSLWARVVEWCIWNRHIVIDRHLTTLGWHTNAFLSLAATALISDVV